MVLTDIHADESMGMAGPYVRRQTATGRPKTYQMKRFRIFLPMLCSERRWSLNSSCLSCYFKNNTDTKEWNEQYLSHYYYSYSSYQFTKEIIYLFILFYFEQYLFRGAQFSEAGLNGALIKTKWRHRKLWKPRLMARPLYKKSNGSWKKKL